MAPPAAPSQELPASTQADAAAAASGVCNYLQMFINGKEYIVEEGTFQPDLTLLNYLRSIGLVVYKAVNACLVPLCSMDGAHIITVEGIGLTTTELHPVQRRLADGHGSQCGYCTPGFVMSMYSLLRKNPTPTKHQIEHSFDGNLCRCTGYRPILDAFKTFGTDGHEDHSAPPSGCCGGAAAAAAASATGEVPPYWNKAEIPFPEKLLPPTYVAKPLEIKGKQTTWYRPVTLTALLELKKRFNDAKIVIGNSELEVERKFRGSCWPVLVTTTHVPELNKVEVLPNGVFIGASTTLVRIRSVMDHLIATLPEEKTFNYQSVVTQLKWFAGTQIRNVGAIGGNVANASPISDLNPVLMSSGSKMTLIKADGSTRELLVRDFFIERMYRKTQLAADELILSFFVPETRPLEFAQGHKVARRRDDDIAIVTAGTRILLKPDGQGFQIVECGLSYGGMAASTVNAKQTEQYLIGKPLTRETLKGALAVLPKDLPLEPGAPGGMIEFRRTLSASFLFKFYLFIMSKVCPDKVDPRELSAGEPYSRPLTHGLQHFKETGEKIIVDPTAGPFNVPGGVGKAVKHMAADLQCTGEAIYVDDMPNPPGGLYAGLVLSQKPRAKLLSVDPAPALAMPGVVGYFDHKDVPGKNNFGAVIYDEECFATNEIVTVGQVIGVIVAENQDLARKAASAVKVEYEPLPAILTIEEAVAAEAYIGDEARIVKGDVDAVFKGAANVVEGEMRIGGQEHFYLETNVTMIVPGENDEFTVYTSSQNPTKTSNFVAHVLGIPKNRVVCKVKRCGGGFGGKETRNVFIGLACAVASKKLHRPVRISLDRDQDMCITGQRHPFLSKYKVAHDADGRILAIDVKLYANGGSSLDLSRPVLERALFHIENAYHIPNVRVVGRVCRTNLPTNTAFRGFGGPQGIIACENYVEHVARALGKHPDDVREINLYPTRGAVTPYGQPLVDCYTREMWAQIKVEADYAARRAAVEEFNAKNRWKKRGISIMPVKFGMSFTAKFMNQASALVHVYTDGTVLVSHGGTEIGQGLHTKMCQIAASELGVPLGKVYICDSSTDKCANTHPTAASVGADLNGMAVQDACKQINARLEKLRHAKPGATLAELAMSAWLDRIDLSAHGYYKTPDIGFNFETQEGKPFHYFAYGVACSEVEVDVLSGDFTTLRTDIIHDVGDSLNPAIDIGQVEGGFVQGLGLFMLEEMVWMRNGQLFTRGPSTYKIPSANDVPIDFRVRLFADCPNRRTIFSSKGVGEPPLNLAISVFMATKDAIAAARADASVNGYFRVDSPLSAERIRLACADEVVADYAPLNIVPTGSW